MRNIDDIVSHTQNLTAACCALELLNNRISIRYLSEEEGWKLNEAIIALRSLIDSVTTRIE